MKMEPIVSSETSAIRTQTPGNYPKRNKLQSRCSMRTDRGTDGRDEANSRFSKILRTPLKADLV